MTFRLLLRLFGALLLPLLAPAAFAAAPDRQAAQELYNATTADAEVFRKAIASPQLRKELERVFKQRLSDDTLQSMAEHARDEAEYWRQYMAGLDQAGRPAPEMRLIPGQKRRIEPVEPIENPNALPPPEPAAPGDILPLPDRWRILDALGRAGNLYDPYNINTLKADKPIFGQDWFVNVSGISDTLYEPSRVPVPVGSASTARAGSNSTFGRYGRTQVNQTEIVSVSLIKGDTAFKPPDFELRVTPAFNFNHTSVGEVGVININPQRGQTRNDTFLGFQEAFAEYHLRNVSGYFDFDSMRVGIQPFSTDFRGFLFQDDQLGFRIFGNRDNNRWQYNLAYFRRLEKDTNSGLNDLTVPVRRDGVFVSNLYRQDFPVPGFTSQLIYVRNDNDEKGEFHYDKNGFLVRPAQIGDDRGYNYSVNYFGYNGDGHFGRLNLTTSAYWALGHQDHNQFNALPNSRASISAFFAAAEPSIDFDWIRIRASGLYASGDAHPQGGHATGFDAIFENPQFAGADTSYWIRRSLPFIGGGGVALNTDNGVLADLRASKGEGQSNFVNPGLILAGIGGDFDVLPELRVSTNFNYLAFANTSSLEFLRNQTSIPPSIGYDLSVALTWRPLQTQNIIFRLSGAALLPGNGLKALFNTNGGERLFSNGNFLYSVLANVILAY
jgi:hypothetical protein